MTTALAIQAIERVDRHADLAPPPTVVSHSAAEAGIMQVIAQERAFSPDAPSAAGGISDIRQRLPPPLRENQSAQIYPLCTSEYYISNVRRYTSPRSRRSRIPLARQAAVRSEIPGQCTIYGFVAPRIVAVPIRPCLKSLARKTDPGGSARCAQPPCRLCAARARSVIAAEAVGVGDGQPPRCGVGHTEMSGRCSRQRAGR